MIERFHEIYQYHVQDVVDLSEQLRLTWTETLL